MNISALICTHEVLKTGSIRGAARELDRAPASVSAAVSRTESELATRLIEKAGTHLSVTLEGRRLLGDLELAAEASRKLAALSQEWSGGDEARRCPAISLLKLSRFCHIARSGSIRSAARDLGVGQPQLSRQVSGFEKQMGAPLFLRAVEGTKLTEQGGEVLSIVETLEEIWKRLSRASNNRFRRTISTCRLGTIIPVSYESDTAFRLASLAARWLQEHPQSPLLISSATAEELLKGLRSGLFDVALLDTDAGPAQLERKNIASTRLALVGQPKLFKSGDPDIRSLISSQPIAVMSPRSGLRQKFRAFLSDTMSETERDALTLAEVDSLPIVVNLVLEHGFLAVLPQSSFANMSAALGSIPLGNDYDLTLTLVWPPTISSKRMAERIIDLF